MYGQQNGYYMPSYNPYMMQNSGAMPDMLNSAKMQYQQPMAQQQMQVPQQLQNSNSAIWIDSEKEAAEYIVAPNNTVIMRNKYQPLIYIKSADGLGMPNFETYKKVNPEETAQKSSATHVCKCKDDYIDKKQFAELEAKFDELKAKFESLAEKPKITVKKTKGDEE